MPFGRPGAEARGEAIEKLRGQRNLRQEHERLALLSQRFGDRLEIDFGLARSRHALEQGGRERAVGDEADELVGRGALVGIEAGRTEVRVERRRAALRRKRDRLKRAVGDKAVDDAGRARSARGERGFWSWRDALRQRREDPRPRLGHARGRLAGRDEAEFRRRRLGDFAGADRHAQEHAARRQGPARRPVDEVAQRRTKRRPVEDLGDRFEIVAAGGARGPDDAGRDAGAERHAHEGAGFELEAGRRAIAVSRVDGDRRKHVDDVRRCAAEIGRRSFVRHGAQTKKPAGLPPALLARETRFVSSSIPWRPLWRRPPSRRGSRPARRCGPTCRGDRADNRVSRAEPCRAARL